MPTVHELMSLPVNRISDFFSSLPRELGVESFDQLAAMEDKIVVIRRLQELIRIDMPNFMGLDVSLQNALDNGATLLHCAAYCGHMEALYALISLGYDKYATDANGLDLLNWAARGGQMHTIRVLIRLGLDVNAKDKSGYGLLHSSLHGGYMDVFNALLDMGFDIEDIEKNEEGTLWMSAIQSGRNNVITSLIEQHGLNPKTMPNDTEIELLVWSSDRSEGIEDKSQFIDYLKNKNDFKQLYLNYLDAFIKVLAIEPISAAFPECIQNIIVGYTCLPEVDSHDSNVATELNIRTLIKQRKAILEPLIQYRRDGVLAPIPML